MLETQYERMEGVTLLSFINFSILIISHALQKTGVLAKKIPMATIVKVFFLLEFTCSVDADCNQGYCEDKKCICLDGFQYKKDCSFSGCE